MTVEILRIYEDHVKTTLTLINVREWLAAFGGTKFSKPIEEMSKEELMNVGLTFLLVCEEERWHVFQKLIDDPSLARAAAQQKQWMKKALSEV